MISIEGLTEGTRLYESRGPHDIPPNAIKSGLSPCGEVYVGVVAHNGMTMPSKIVPKHSNSYFPYFGKELSKKTFTFLVTDPEFTYEWVASARGELPEHAARVGKASNGEPFAVGRVTVSNERCVGKVVPGHRRCYVPMGGKELQEEYYDVLVIRPPAVNPSVLTPGTALYYSSGPHDVPSNAIATGVSPCGQVYVGLVQHAAETAPAKIIPRDRLAYYCYSGKEHSTAKFTFLTVNPGYTYEWVPSSNGTVPANAAKLGRVWSGENFFVGRVTIDDERCVGKILASHRVCYVPKSGLEHQKKYYDALVIKRRR